MVKHTRKYKRRRSLRRKQRGGRPVHIFLLMIHNMRDKIRHLVNIITADYATNPEHYRDVYITAKRTDSFTQELAAYAKEAAEQGNEDLGFGISERISNELRSLRDIWETTHAFEENARVPSQNGGDALFDVIYTLDNREVVLPPGGHTLVKREQTAERPRVMFAKDVKRAYIIAMYDQDAPDPARLHWLVVFWVDRISMVRWQIETLLDYEPPNPPPGETHTYTIQLLSKVMNPDEDIVQVMPDQTHFNMEEFIRNEGFDRGQKRVFRVGPA